MPETLSDIPEVPEKELDPILAKLLCHNRMKNRSKRSPEWVFFVDAGIWQTTNGIESKFRIANCLYCLKDNIQTKIRGKIETMKNHILNCERIPAPQKDVYERHPSRYRKRPSTGDNVEIFKRQKSVKLLDSPPAIDGLTNCAVVLHGAGDIRIDRIPLPTIRPGHVLIAMRSVSICHSDVEYWQHGRIGSSVVQKPMVLGREGSGVVRMVGEDVVGLSEGDRVAIEPSISCFTCTHCKDGRYNLCRHSKTAASPLVDGVLAHYVIHPATFCHKLTPMVSFDEAALCEPLSVGINACRKGKVSVGHTVFLTGAGPVGLMCMIVAKAFGATEVIIHDVDTNRLQVAKELGADRVQLTHSEGDPKITAEGLNADVCIDTTGLEPAIQACVYGAKQGGIVVITGLGSPQISFPLFEASTRDLETHTILRHCNTYPTALKLITSGKAPVRRLISHRFKINQAQEAFEMAHDMTNKPIKVLIDCTSSMTTPLVPQQSASTQVFEKPEQHISTQAFEKHEQHILDLKYP